MCELYKLFAKDWENCLDFGEESMLEMYHSETHGLAVSKTNGFYHGKKYLNVTVAMWKEDLARGTLFRVELYNDPRFPHSWLDKVLGP